MRQKSWSPSSVWCVAARKIVRRSVLGAGPRYSLVVDEDVKKPTKQRNKQLIMSTVKCATRYLELVLEFLILKYRTFDQYLLR